jgi:hypothetical protein
MNITVGALDWEQGPDIRDRLTRARPRELKMTALTIRKTALALTLFASFAVFSSPGFAFSSEAQQMCTGDAFRLCSSEIPNIPKITACMIKQRSNLSAGCRAVMDRDMAAKSTKVAAQ